jgi:hypothetical protein
MLLVKLDTQRSRKYKRVRVTQQVNTLAHKKKESGRAIESNAVVVAHDEFLESGPSLKNVTGSVVSESKEVDGLKLSPRPTSLGEIVVQLRQLLRRNR